MLLGYLNPGKGYWDNNIYNINIWNNILIGDDGYAVTYHEGDYDSYNFS